VTAPTEKYHRHLDQLARRRMTANTPEELSELQYFDQFAARAKFVKVDGIVHHYLEFGEPNAPAVLLLHGWDCSSYWFHRLGPQLAQAGYRAIAFDFRGHGFSESDPKERYDIPCLAREVLAIADALNLNRFHVASFSLGSAVAIFVSELAPERVRGQIVMNFGLFGHGTLKERLLPRLLNSVFGGLRRIPSTALIYHYISVAMCQRDLDPLDITMGLTALHNCDPRAAYLAVSDLVTAERTDHLVAAAAGIHAPFLSIVGEFDPIIPFSESHRLAAHAPRGEMHILERTGHLVLFERPDEIEKIIVGRLNASSDRLKMTAP
jgi:pimeloyl-ACP methyl ester carboxylesterase